MARSLSSAKLLSALVVDGFSNAISRRGYAAASRGALSNVTTRSGNMAKKPSEVASETKEKVAWVPDPVTGFYRPENQAEEIDVAELRAMLLKKH